MANMKIIQGNRRELEYQLLHAMFTPGGNANAESLKQRLVPRGKDRVHAVGAASVSPNKPPSASEPVKDRN